jgi:alpha-glucuronidase
MWARLCCWLLTLAALTCASTAQAEDGYDAWLRYARLNGAALQGVSAHTTAIVAPAQIAATRELQRGIAGMTGRTPALSQTPVNGAILLATPAANPAVPDLSFKDLGEEGYAIARPPCGARPSP